MDKSVHMSSLHPPGQDTPEKFWKEPAFTPLPMDKTRKAAPLPAPAGICPGRASLQAMFVQAERWMSSVPLHGLWPEQKPGDHSPGKEQNNGNANQDWRLAATLCIVDAHPDRDAQDYTDHDEQDQAGKDPES
jgi:hypothetical protein